MSEQSAATVLMSSQKLLQDVHRFIVKQDRATPQKTPSSYGKDMLARLEREGKLKTFTSVKEESSILSQEKLRELSNLQTEHQIVTFMTPYLEMIFRQGLNESTTVLVNSEEYKWLQTADDDTTFNQKPDLFVCHKSIYKDRPPFNSQDQKLLEMRSPTDNFGVLADWRLRRFLYVVCEAKKNIDNSGFGQTVNYGSHICFKEDGPVTVRLILFDTKEFWLVECVKGVASSVEKCGWSQNGSLSLLQNFPLRNPLMEALDEACKAFKLTVDQDSFLGEGAFGVVFLVKNQQGKLFALKIVSDECNHVKELKTQAEITSKAKERCPDFVVGIESGGFRYFEKKGGVLLQSEVGGHYSTLSEKKIIEALDALHSENILHGDCRVENIVNVNGQAQWIDLRVAFFLPKNEHF